MKKLLFLLIVLAIVVLSFSSCSNNTQNESIPNSQENLSTTDYYATV
ncbi:hypothetical protein RBG61_11440 [Paludicola sp. MB14-C6]|nr:hypothetical protein [Paludicola sp. MB14-C6]WMJ22596.1 hypothetical protein RBG61_11440 [Paludicola sp. MB14-C6]